MRNRILEIVVFLMDYLQRGAGGNVLPEELSSTLEQLGYSDGEINSAYKWMLDRIQDAPETCFSKFPQKPLSHRILTPAERRQISPEAFGFLLKLKSLSLIEEEQLEIILDRAVQLGTFPINEAQMKLLISSVLFPELGGFVFEDSFSQPVSRKKNYN